MALTNSAAQWAVDLLGPQLSQDKEIGAVLATRLLSTDARSTDVWAAIDGADGAPTTRALDRSVPLVNSSWAQVLPRLQDANPQRLHFPAPEE